MEATTLPELTDEQEDIVVGLTDQVDRYVTNEPLRGVEVDDGFYYDYGSITNAWHSQPSVEFDEHWGEIELDVGEVEDYILDHLVEWASEEHSSIYYNLQGRYEDTMHHIKAKWYWTRSKGKVFLCCELA